MHIISVDNGICLHSMDDKYYQYFSKRVIKQYAVDMVSNGRWQEEEADDKSLECYNQLLPEGINSKANHLYIIKDDSSNNIGDLWLQERGEELHIVSIYLVEEKRGGGIGAAVASWIEKWASKKNFNFITLHVFESNKNAIMFYKKMGFESYENGMHKRINL